MWISSYFLVLYSKSFCQGKKQRLHMQKVEQRDFLLGSSKCTSHGEVDEWNPKDSLHTKLTYT